MRVLLTGATGFLGSRLLQALLAAGHEVGVLKRSTSDPKRIAALLPQVRCFDVDRMAPDAPFSAFGPVDVLVHAAACYGRGGERLAELFEANLAWPMALLDQAVRHGVGRFVNAGTSLPASVSPYALGKRQFVDWGRCQAQAGGLAFVNLALEHFYGPGDDRSKFVTWVAASCLENRAELALTAGEQVRDFIHVDDAVAAFMALLSAPVAGGFAEYPVGSGRGVTIRRLVETIKALCGAPTELRFGAVPYRADEVMVSVADTRALAALGWQPRIALEQGLAEMIAAIKEECS